MSSSVVPERFFSMSDGCAVPTHPLGDPTTPRCHRRKQLRGTDPQSHISCPSSMFTDFGGSTFASQMIDFHTDQTTIENRKIITMERKDFIKKGLMGTGVFAPSALVGNVVKNDI